MTFLAPGFLVATLFAALAAIALHLIAWRRPDDLLLPTARFVPDQSSRRSARAARPSDLLLLLLRLVVLALVGVALARPMVTPRRAGLARVVAVDRSRAVADFAAARDSALVLANGADAVEFVVFDSATAIRSAAELRTMDTLPSQGKGSLSTAFVTLLRRADAMRARHTRVEMAIVSPFATELFDAATLGLRELWWDSIRLVQVAPASTAAARGTVDVRAPHDDPVAAGVRLAIAHAIVDRTADARLVRGPLTGPDSVWAREGDRVLVHWPISSGTAASREARGVAAGGIEGADAVRGVLAGDRAVVGHLRAFALEDTGVVVARWLDGTAAALQQGLGRGCLRHIGFDVPREGDFTLSPAFRRVAAALLAPCEGSAAMAPLADTLLARLASGAPDTNRSSMARLALRGAGAGDGNRLGASLLALALGLALLELLLRQQRRPKNVDAAVGASVP